MSILILYLHMLFYFDIIVKSTLYRLSRVFFFRVSWLFHLCMCKEYVTTYTCTYSLYTPFEDFIVSPVEMTLHE